LARTLYVDESGNDAADVHFVVVGVAPADLGALGASLRALRGRWPWLGDGLKASAVSNPGWLASQWLRAAPSPLRLRHAVELADIEAAVHDRADQLLLLEGAGAAGQVPEPAALVSIGLGPVDRAFAWWSAAVRQAAKGAPLPVASDHAGLRSWWQGLSTRLPPKAKQLPAMLVDAYTRALFQPGGEAWVSREAPAGALRGAPARYTRLLGQLIGAAHAGGIDAFEVQGRHVPQRAAAGTALAGAARPMVHDDLCALGAPAAGSKVVDFRRLAGSRPAHLLVDAAAWAARRPGGTHLQGWSVVELHLPTTDEAQR
jgi:hypothetical protein